MPRTGANRLPERLHVGVVLEGSRLRASLTSQSRVSERLAYVSLLTPSLLESCHGSFVRNGCPLGNGSGRWRSGHRDADQFSLWRASWLSSDGSSCRGLWRLGHSRLELQRDRQGTRERCLCTRAGNVS